MSINTLKQIKKSIDAIVAAAAVAALDGDGDGDVAAVVSVVRFF